MSEPERIYLQPDDYDEGGDNIKTWEERDISGHDTEYVRVNSYAGLGHDIEMVCGGELASCKRCHGGEADLEEPCAVRIARDRDRLQAIADTLRKTNDGVHMVPGGIYWVIAEDVYCASENDSKIVKTVWWYTDPEIGNTFEFLAIDGCDWEEFTVDGVYSTLEAAAIAKGTVI